MNPQQLIRMKLLKMSEELKFLREMVKELSKLVDLEKLEEIELKALNR